MCVAASDVNDSANLVTAPPQVKTWFIIRRLFEPEEPSDAVPAGGGGGGDAAAHVTVKVENAVLDGGVMKEVMLLTLYRGIQYYAAFYTSNLTAVGEVLGKIFCQEKLFIATFTFGTTPVFSRLLRDLYCLFKNFAG